ncbi:MAG: signal peptidase II [Candidatus Eisenbacteria bacterium]|uniref:Lipoprotein signal peptidase n=1 Tax=Eiseniibacteriota bacterium TaxID=2212470 RepID=A0A937XBY4_UNCEI|nr:signal peptidase II [Candidatus Eisenbacteria bacterium]
MRRFLASAAAVLLADQASKAIARSLLDDGAIVPLLGEWLRLRLVHNPGAAFGLFHGGRWLFVVISLASMAMILYLILSRRHVFAGSLIAFGCVFGGALGNLLDRLWLSGVTDFIDMGVGPHRWPTYNVADMGVTLGVLYLGIGFLLLDSGGREARPRDA